MRKIVEYKVTSKDKGLPVRSLLKNKLNISHRLLRSIKYRGGEILLNDNQVQVNKEVNTGDSLKVIFPKEISNFEPQDIKFEIIFEDNDLLIINKPVGYVVHPTKGHPKNTIANGIMKYMLDKGDEYKIRFVNRLDMDTSGVMVVGKNPFVQDDFTKQAGNGGVHKKYIAFVNGVIEQNAGTIDLPIGHDDPGKVERIVKEGGAESVTHYKVLERYNAHTKVELELDTGRTHQIRVHLAHIGYPIISDVLYGKSQPHLIERQALHASELIFTHPTTRRPIKAIADMPLDLTLLQEKL